MSPSSRPDRPPRPPRVLITAGPTHEPIDAVRYIGNRSSGRLGVELASAAAARDMSVTLLLGPSSIPLPSSPNLTIIRFRTTADLRERLHEQFADHDILIMAAAVADFRPEAPANGADTEAGAETHTETKIPRGDDALTLRLVPTPDLLAEITRTARTDQTVIGFALEPADRLDASARAKLVRKNVDGIVANPLRTMESPNITATLVLRDETERRPPADLTKREFAEWLLDRVVEL